METTIENSDNQVIDRIADRKKDDSECVISYVVEYKIQHTDQDGKPSTVVDEIKVFTEKQPINARVKAFECAKNLYEDAFIDGKVYPLHIDNLQEAKRKEFKDCNLFSLAISCRDHENDFWIFTSHFDDLSEDDLDTLSVERIIYDYYGFKKGGQPSTVKSHDGKKVYKVLNMKLMPSLSKREIDHLLFGFVVDTTNRIETFLDIADKLKNENYWYGLGQAIDDCEILHFCKNQVKKALQDKTHQGREHMMSEEERAKFAQLPDEITIYRGMTMDEYNSGDFGVAWSLDKKQAEFFAYEFFRYFSIAGIEKTVHQMTVKKADVIAYFEREDTIIYVHNPK